MPQLARIVSARLAQALATAALLATLCFGFVQALPGDLALRVAAARVGDERLTPEMADRIRREEGLDRPLIVQYGLWMATLARGDLGRSLVSGKPVTQELAYHAKFTLQLGLIGWLLSLPWLCRWGSGPACDRVAWWIALPMRWP
jgi:peptide/nickel transport system permease protein